MNSTTWIEVDNNYFENNERDGFHIVLIVHRCTQLKRSVKRVQDSVEFIGDDRKDAEAQLVRYMERPNVKLIGVPEEQAA